MTTRTARDIRNIEALKGEYLAQCAENNDDPRTYSLAKAIENCGGELPAVPISDVLIFDMAGYGFRVLTTMDRRTWMNHRAGRTLNQNDVDRILDRLGGEQSSAVIHRVTDFDCRIPAHLLREGARVI